MEKIWNFVKFIEQFPGFFYVDNSILNWIYVVCVLDAMNRIIDGFLENLIEPDNKMQFGAAKMANEKGGCK